MRVDVGLYSSEAETIKVHYPLDGDETFLQITQGGNVINIHGANVPFMIQAWREFLAKIDEATPTEEEPDVAHCDWCRERMAAEAIEGEVPLAIQQLDGEWLCETCADKWVASEGVAEREADQREAEGYNE